MSLVETPLLKQLRKLSLDFREEFDTYLTPYYNRKHIHKFEGWEDYFWESDVIRKCHLKTIEPSESTTNLWLMHINIFPHTHIDLPILGLDIVSSPTKISGCFFDFSPTTPTRHQYMDVFEMLTKDLTWKKERVLPPWAKEIFSEYIIGAGSVREGPETDQLRQVTLRLLRYYVQGMDDPRFVREDLDTKEAQNKYCRNQKTNVQLHKSILAMGISEEDKNQYVENVLFEEI
jgi:hypothetical protein